MTRTPRLRKVVNASSLSPSISVLSNERMIPSWPARLARSRSAATRTAVKYSGCTSKSRCTMRDLGDRVREAAVDAAERQLHGVMPLSRAMSRSACGSGSVSAPGGPELQSSTSAP